MKNKQIIDGIDVSECIYFRMNNKMPMCRACNSGVGSPYCEYHKDCYYKQLKRAEQKLEKIEEVITHHYCNPQIAHTGCKYDEMILQIIEGKENE